MKGGALWVWVLVFALLGAYALALPTALYAEGDTASSTPSEPTGVLLDSSYIDSSWNISVYGGGHYVYFLDGYTTIGNPPTVTGRGWVTTGTVTTARIKTTPGTPCDQFRWGGTYGLILTADDMATSYASNPSYTRAVGDDLCEFKFTTPIPSGTRISVAFLGLTGTAEILGSSQNPGTSLTGTYENPVSGGFALQLCGADGCAGGFTLPPTATTTPEIPSPDPEESASSTPPTPDPEETASSTPPVTETEEPATTTPEVPTEPEVTTPPERSHGGGGRNPSKIPDPIVPEVVTPPTTVAVAETSEAQAPVRAPRRAAAAPLATAAVATSTPTQAVVATTTTTAQIVVQDPPEQPEAPSNPLMAGVGAALPAGADMSVLFYIPLLLAILLLLILIIRLIQDMVHEARAEQHERQAYQYHYNT